MNGILYGVSVGPGDPELLTLKAVKTIQSCPVIATPQTGGEKTLALDIAKGAVDMDGKEILILPFLMTRDKELLEKSHQDVANSVISRLKDGKDVALLNLGDVSVYSSFSYIMDMVVSAGYQSQMIPGVTSFCAVAATLGTSLTTMHQPIHIYPGGSTAEALTHSGTKVLMKTGKAMVDARRAIQEAGLESKTMLVQNCGLPNQQVHHKLSDASDDISYFTTIIVKD